MKSSPYTKRRRTYTLHATPNLRQLNAPSYNRRRYDARSTKSP